MGNKVENKSWKTKLSEYKVLLVFSVLFVGSAVWLLCAFLRNQEWSLSWQADGNLWGVYGDFVGGVFGVVVVIVSTYYLIETLRNQKDANKEVSEANTRIINLTYLQQIDTKYKHLIEQYEKLKDQQNRKDYTLHRKVETLISKRIDTTLNYEVRNKSAYRIFDNEFYIPNRETLSVQFRVLYQLLKLIDGIEDLDEDNKNDAKRLLYAKLIRCQLNEDELFLIRYNCFCTYGENMKQYVNKYNLLKHLPLLSLIEFQYWRDKYGDDKTLKNAIDTEFIKQKKFITGYVNISDVSESPAHISDRYELFIQKDNTRKNFTYRLVYHEDVASTESIDKAFDVLLLNNYMLDFLNDFLHELFEYSNFRLYNQNLNYTGRRVPNKDNRTISFVLNVNSGSNPLRLKIQEQENDKSYEGIHPEKIK